MTTQTTLDEHGGGCHLRSDSVVDMVAAVYDPPIGKPLVQIPLCELPFGPPIVLFDSVCVDIARMPPERNHTPSW